MEMRNERPVERFSTRMKREFRSAESYATRIAFTFLLVSAPRRDANIA